MRGSDFIRSLPPGGDRASIEAREKKVVDALRRGISLPIAWVPVRTQIPGHKALVYVASDTLRFGEDGPNAEPDNWDWVRIAVTPTTAQRIADQLGVLLPTDKLLDLVHAQADVRLTPHFQDPVKATTGAMLKHHAAIEAERAGRDGLLSTLGKDWILGNELFPPHPGALPPHRFGYDGAINYGWHIDATPEDLAAIAHHQSYPREPYRGPYMGQPGIVLWQTRGYRHNRGHVDYSQWVPRFVHPWMEVNGEQRRTADVMQSPTLSGLVSYEGPLRGTRFPDRAQNRAAGGTRRRDAPEAGSPSDPFADEIDANGPDASGHFARETDTGDIVDFVSKFRSETVVLKIFPEQDPILMMNWTDELYDRGVLFLPADAIPPEGWIFANATRLEQIPQSAQEDAWLRRLHASRDVNIYVRARAQEYDASGALAGDPSERLLRRCPDSESGASRSDDPTARAVRLLADLAGRDDSGASSVDQEDVRLPGAAGPSPTLSGLVSYEGPLRGTRFPARAQNRAAGGSGRREAPEAGSPSDPFDDLKAKRSPHVCNGCGGPVWWERHETARARDLAIRCGFCMRIFCLPCSLLHFGAVR